MYAGAASGAVTIGLALFLIMLSHKPDASETLERPTSKTPVVETTPASSPVPQAAVVLPPPPVALPPPLPAPPRIEREPLKPRPVKAPVETAKVTPLKPRPQSMPTEASSPPASGPVPAPEESPQEEIASLPEAVQAPEPATNPASVGATPQTAREGRALLKMLETGKGPVIEIAWPREQTDRSRLYRLLTACYGVQTAILVNGRALYVANSEPGKAWNVNRDAISGFIRKPSGVTTDAERSTVTRIRTRHGIALGDTVRLFPRGIDAVMLGGLGRIIGPGYINYRTIRARYRLVGGQITVVDIRVDGIDRPGQVALPGTGRCNA